MALNDADRVYGFDEDVARALKPLAGIANPEAGQARLANSPSFIAKAPSGGIPARSGSTTLPNANCQLYWIDSGTLTDAGLSAQVFNLSKTLIPANSYIVAIKAGGVLIALMPFDFDVRITAGYTELQKTFNGGDTWTKWADVVSCD